MLSEHSEHSEYHGRVANPGRQYYTYRDKTSVAHVQPTEAVLAVSRNDVICTLSRARICRSSRQRCFEERVKPSGSQPAAKAGLCHAWWVWTFSDMLSDYQDKEASTDNMRSQKERDPNSWSTLVSLAATLKTKLQNNYACFSQCLDYDRVDGEISSSRV